MVVDVDHDDVQTWKHFLHYWLLPADGLALVRCQDICRGGAAEISGPVYIGVVMGYMMTSSNGSFFRITGPLCGEFTGHRWIPLTKGQ